MQSDANYVISHGFCGWVDSVWNEALDMEKFSHLVMPGSSGPWLCTASSSAVETEFDCGNPGIRRVLRSECQRLPEVSLQSCVQCESVSEFSTSFLWKDWYWPTSEDLSTESSTLRSYASESLREDQELLGWWQGHQRSDETVTFFVVFWR